MCYNKEFVHQVGKKDYNYIRMHGQQNIEIKQGISEETDPILLAMFLCGFEKFYELRLSAPILMHDTWQLLFARSKFKAVLHRREKRLLSSSCLSVCLIVAVRLPLDGFP